MPENPDELTLLKADRQRLLRRVTQLETDLSRLDGARWYRFTIRAALVLALCTAIACAVAINTRSFYIRYSPGQFVYNFHLETFFGDLVMEKETSKPMRYQLFVGK